MKYRLPTLPYTMDALAPELSKETLEFHYGKHHNTYIEKMNGLLDASPLKDETLETVVKKADGPLFNNAAQAWNHTFYWLGLTTKRGGQPKGDLKAQIEKEFGSLDAFKKQFLDSATGLFGSAWAWLALDGKNLKILGTSNAENPIRQSLVPLLTCDVWEHAYYIDYRNARPKYLEGYWNLINWDFVAENYAAATPRDLTKVMKV